MRALRIFTGLGFVALSACQPGVGPPMSWGHPVPPLEQALAARCPDNSAVAAGMDAAINALRGAEGKTLLESDASLAQIAQSHACDIARRGRAGVEGANGSGIVDRARAVGYPVCGVVQLVSRGGSPTDAVSGWMAAEAQRTELLGQTSRQIGSGYAIGADAALMAASISAWYWATTADEAQL